MTSLRTPVKRVLYSYQVTQQQLGPESSQIYVDLLHVPNATHVHSSELVTMCFQGLIDNETDLVLA